MSAYVLVMQTRAPIFAALLLYQLSVRGELRRAMRSHLYTANLRRPRPCARMPEPAATVARARPPKSSGDVASGCTIDCARSACKVTYRQGGLDGARARSHQEVIMWGIYLRGHPWPFAYTLVWNAMVGVRA